MGQWSKWIVTCGGLGKLPKAPGTWGSLGAVFFWWAVWQLSSFEPTLYWITLILFLFFGTLSIQHYEKRSGKKDPSEIVIDEWVGVGFALALTPPTWFFLVIGFFLFRLFDIWKPWGVRYFDRNHLKGWGTMLDDVVAGLYAALILGVIYEYGLFPSL